VAVNDDLSPAEQDLARELSGLAVDPSPKARESIMRAVSAARPAEPQAPRRQLRWRVMTAALAAVLALVTGTVGVLAASSQALPGSPAYSLRGAGEQIRIAFASPVGQEELRIQFARDRFQQVPEVVHQSRSDARRLIDDGSNYLAQTRQNLPSLSAGQQGQVQNQLNQAGQDQQAAQDELNQQGQQG
jgi:hypothetical protein